MTAVDRLKEYLERSNPNLPILFDYENVKLFLTTIESQKEEIELKESEYQATITKLNTAHKYIASQNEEINRLMGVNQHLEIDLSESKAITELAVKRLKEISNHHPGIADTTLTEIERLQNA